MPSIKSQVYLSALENNRSFFGRIGKSIMDMNPSGHRVANMPILGTRGKYLSIGDLPAIFVSPQQIKSEKHVLLHCHGGAYVSGNLLQSRVVASHAAASTGLHTLTFAYRLAPEHTFPAQLEDALFAYHYLLDQGYQPNHIGLIGESAGGNLALALTLYLKKEGLPLPGCLVLL
ncbi:MAG: alpha/beta hydrolase [Clostridiales bacterium]|nr:alpha/beta hydrolase [Clostridiales bacterium]